MGDRLCQPTVGPTSDCADTGLVGHLPGCLHCAQHPAQTETTPVVTVHPLEGSNAGWTVEALEEAFLRHGPPKHTTTDQEGVFVSDAFAQLLGH
jgi:hypothetical protein